MPGSARSRSTWKGSCHLLFQYDVGQSVDLERCKTLGQGQPARIHQAHRAPVWFQFDPLPFQMLEERAPVEVGRHRTAPSVTSLVYDFGVVSVAYVLPFEGSISDLVELSCSLQESDRLWEDSLAQVQRVLEAIRPAVTNAAIAAPTEDYAIFEVESVDPPVDLRELSATHRAELAQILRGEREPLSPEEIDEAVECPVSYGLDDVAWVDWQAALLVGKGWADVRAVLEFASAQLLEMRFLDHKLDVALDRSYETLGARRRLFSRRSFSAEIVRVARMQVDAAILFEQVINALKLLGDQYLARVYHLASRQFHLPEWNATILRKLETVDSIYQKLNDQADAKRMEALEWIIIVLIAVSMALPFLTGFGH